MAVSMAPTRNRQGKSMTNPTSGIRMDAFCTHSLQIPGAHPPGISMTVTRMEAMTGTGGDGLEHPRTDPCLLELGVGSVSERSPFLQ